MSDHNAKIRNYWLLMLAFSCLWSLSGIYFSEPVISSRLAGPLWYVSIVFAVMPSILMAFILYRCAHKKPGTKFLTFNMVASGVGIITSLGFYLTGSLDAFSALHRYYEAYFVVSQLIGIVWIMACWKMRALNKQLQKISA